MPGGTPANVGNVLPVNELWQSSRPGAGLSVAAAVNVHALEDLTVLHRLGLAAGEYHVAGTERRLKVRWLPAGEFGADRAQQYVVVKCSPVAGFALQVCLPEELFQALLQELEPAQFWQLDELLRCACLQVRNNGVVQWLNQRWQCSLRVDGVALQEQPAPPRQALAFRLSTAGGLEYPPGLVAPVDARQPCALSALCETGGGPARNIDGQRAPLRLDAILGRTRVPVAALQGLQVDDIIVPAAGECSATEALLCVQGRALFSAGVEQDALRVKQFLGANVMADETETTGDDLAAAGAGEPDAEQAAAAASLSPEDIEVTLHFSLGSLTRTLAEINQIAERDVLELPRRVAGGVDILVNGKRLASGEPVRIEDRIGIRVVKVDNG